MGLGVWVWGHNVKLGERVKFTIRCFYFLTNGLFFIFLLFLFDFPYHFEVFLFCHSVLYLLYWDKGKGQGLACAE